MCSCHSFIHDYWVVYNMLCGLFFDRVIWIPRLLHSRFVSHVLILYDLFIKDGFCFSSYFRSYNWHFLIFVNVNFCETCNEFVIVTSFVGFCLWRVSYLSPLDCIMCIYCYRLYVSWSLVIFLLLFASSSSLVPIFL